MQETAAKSAVEPTTSELDTVSSVATEGHSTLRPSTTTAAAPSTTQPKEPEVDGLDPKLEAAQSQAQKGEKQVNGTIQNLAARWEKTLKSSLDEVGPLKKEPGGLIASVEALKKEITKLENDYEALQVWGLNGCDTFPCFLSSSITPFDLPRLHLVCTSHLKAESRPCYPTRKGWLAWGGTVVRRRGRRLFVLGLFATVLSK